MITPGMGAGKWRGRGGGGGADDNRPLRSRAARSHPSLRAGAGSAARAHRRHSARNGAGGSADAARGESGELAAPASLRPPRRLGDPPGRRRHRRPRLRRLPAGREQPPPLPGFHQRAAGISPATPPPPPRGNAAVGTETWSFHVRQSGSGRLAGLTSVAWNPGKPEIVFQQETLVRQEHRNCGLGRWLKAAMLEKILAERTKARWVETVNAESNAAMLKINVELGFQLHQIVRNWQLAVDRAEAYLRA